jgi:glucokinase-like ROK family protein
LNEVKIGSILCDVIHRQTKDRPNTASRDVTRSRVFDVLAVHGRISRPRIAEITGLSRATISIIIDELLESGLVTHSGSGSSSGGRPPTLLQFRPSAAYAIGASLYDDNWRIVATDLSSQVVAHEFEAIPDQSAETAIDGLVRGIDRLRNRLDPSRVLPVIGIGPPGLIDMDHGVVKSAVDLGWKEVPIGAEVERRTGLRTLVANRSKAGALAVLWRVAKPETTNLVYVSIGTGVAAGIILSRELFVGSNSSAGELGHMTIVPDGPLCECGNRGCLQQLVSEQAIGNAARLALRHRPEGLLHTAHEHHPELLTAFDVLEAAEQGDAVAVTVVEEVAEYLAIAVGNLVNLLNPQIVVLGGPIAEASPRLIENVASFVRRHAMAYPLSAARIIRKTLGPETAAIGAAVLVLQHANTLYFELPAWTK